MIMKPNGLFSHNAIFLVVVNEMLMQSYQEVPRTRTRITRILTLVGLVLLTTAPGRAADPAPVLTRDQGISVKDYGAKGDGETDDTEAIRAAVKTASRIYSANSSVGTYIQSGPVLLFPPGRYLISDTIMTDGCLEIEGVGRPVVIQKDNSKDIFANHYAWRMSIRNITFEGGRHQIDLKNPNLDTGQLIIDHCRFYGAASFAICNHVRSTMLTISDCVFVRCRQIWQNGAADQSMMRDCWINPTKMGDYAAIEHHGGMMSIENVVGVPPPGSRKRRWIDNHAEWLTLRKFRFGGEHAGMTPVVNYSKYTYGLLDRGKNRDLGVNIILDDCFIVDNGTDRKCAVYCVEVPNLLRITNSTLCTGIDAVRIDKKIDLSTYFRVISPSALSFSVAGTIGSNVHLPAGLSQPVVNSVAEEVPDDGNLRKGRF